MKRRTNFLFNFVEYTDDVALKVPNKETGQDASGDNDLNRFLKLRGPWIES